MNSKEMQFKEISSKSHLKNEFDYSKVIISKNFKEKVLIKHNKCGYEFLQRAQYHMDGGGCGFCSGRLETQESFLNKVSKIYVNTDLDFSKVEYLGTYTSVEVLCKKCNISFFKKPSYLVNNISETHCPSCSLERKAKEKRICTGEDRSLSSLEYFKKKGEEIHGGKFLYSLVDKYPSNNKEKVSLLCPEHGSFEQRVDCHLNGQGCPSCTSNRSKAEKEIFEYIESLGENPLHTQKLLDGKHIDILIPRISLGIEYDGLYFHGHPKEYHLQKTEKALELGMNLIHIFEDEWIYKKDIVKSRLLAILGKSEKVYARHTEIQQISFSDIREFFEKTHIQGGGTPSSFNYGLFKDGVLVAAMSFSKSRFDSREQGFELIRFSSVGTVVGGFSKLLKNFIKQENPCSIVTYADKRWSQGKVYEKNGFIRKEDTSVGYFWCKGQKRFNRLNFQKHKLKGLFKNFNPDLTEEENCVLNGYTKVYDCGQMKFEMILK